MLKRSEFFFSPDGWKLGLNQTGILSCMVLVNHGDFPDRGIQFSALASAGREIDM